MNHTVIITYICINIDIPRIFCTHRRFINKGLSLFFVSSCNSVFFCFGKKIFFSIDQNSKYATRFWPIFFLFCFCIRVFMWVCVFMNDVPMSVFFSGWSNSKTMENNEKKLTLQPKAVIFNIHSKVNKAVNVAFVYCNVNLYSLLCL